MIKNTIPDPKQLTKTTFTQTNYDLYESSSTRIILTFPILQCLLSPSLATVPSRCQAKMQLPLHLTPIVSNERVK